MPERVSSKVENHVNVFMLTQEASESLLGLMNLQISVHRSCRRPSDERVTGWELFICAESSSWHRDSGTCPGFSCLPRQFFLAAVFSAGLSRSGDSVHHLSE